MSGETWTLLDLETTGLDPLLDRVVQITAQRIRWTGARAGEPLCSLVNPERPIPAAASAIHHLTDRHVANAPTFAELLPSLVKELLPDGPDKVPVLVAHNAPFDAKFLLAELGRASWKNLDGAELRARLAEAQLLCTYRLALHLVDSDAGYGLQALRYALDLKIDAREFDADAAPTPLGAHRAAEDAAVTRELYGALVERWLRAREAEHHTAAPQDLGLADPTPAELLAFCWAPIRHRRMPRGKHAGVPLAEVPLDYLAWAARKKPWAGYSDDLQTCVEAELARRVENRR